MNKKIVVLFSFLTSALVGITLFSSSLQAEPDSNSKSRQEAIRKFSNLLSAVEKSYVDELNITTIIEKSMNGLLTNLDAHSSFLNVKKFEEMNIKTKGEFGGLGITVGQRNGALTVISPIDDTPAFRAGIKSGDIILKINEKSTIGMSLDEAVGYMRGKPKTEIKLTLVRKGENKPLVKKIIRDIIKINSVSWKMNDHSILYIRVSSFDKNVESGIKNAIIANEKEVKGIILDLRNNPGGLLDQAVRTGDLFINKGIIVSQKGRDARENIEFTAHDSGTYTKYPMVVLVNGGSASASEIVAGALQDHKRAVIIGEKTFGKGSVQAIIPVGRKEAIRLTIARYYLPSGRTIQAVGITPDIELKQAEIKTIDNDDFLIKEAQLKKHLKAELDKANGVKRKEPTKKELEKDKHILTNKNLRNDYQLKSAVGILKALVITQNRD